MSNTYRDKLKVNIDKYYKDKWDRHVWDEAPKPPNYKLKHELGITDEILEIHLEKYSKGNNRFHHEFTHVPNRRAVKAAMKKVLRLEDYEDWDPSDLPVHGKPYEYYL